MSEKKKTFNGTHRGNREPPITGEVVRVERAGDRRHRLVVRYWHGGLQYELPFEFDTPGRDFMRARQEGMRIKRFCFKAAEHYRRSPVRVKPALGFR